MADEILSRIDALERRLGERVDSLEGKLETLHSTLTNHRHATGKDFLVLRSLLKELNKPKGREQGA